MRKLLVVLAVMSTALAASTYVFWRDRENERARADALQARIAALENERVMTAAWQPTPPDAATPAVHATSAAHASQANPDAADDAIAAHAEYLELRRRLLSDPKYYEAARAGLLPSFADRRAELIRALGITPAKADEIVDYWIDRQLRQEPSLLNPGATEQELRERAELVVRQQRENDERLRAITGDELFPRMQEYTASRPSRYRTNQLRTRLGGSDDALRDDQIEPLVKVLHAEQVRHQQEVQDYVQTLNPDDVGSAEDQQATRLHLQDLVRSSNRRIHASTAPLLSSKQLAELDAIFQAEFDVFRAQQTQSLMEANASEN